jgi:oxygen-independent coproporphyrinogen-3 oxidase
MPTSLYLHIPFCRHRCAYCDFNTYAGLDHLAEKYMAALEREIRSFVGGDPIEIGTIFFGGGTPSLIPVDSLERILGAVLETFRLDPQAEITLEANPGTVSPEYLANLRSAGVDRLSMGMQSASPDDLRVLEREHDYFDVVNAVTWARRAGFENINLDLIFGLPYQTLAGWQRTLELTAGLKPDHLSVYNLILEHGTPMNAWVGRGLLPSPDEDLAADMYEHAQARLAELGYEQYEISNWAKRDRTGELLACRHNLQYWRNLPYLGLGAGAHGYAGGFRTVNVRAPQAYIERMTAEDGFAPDDAPEEANALVGRPFPMTAATVNAVPIDTGDEMGETMMMGLRLIREGVSAAGFRSRFGVGIADAFPAQTEGLIRQGLLEWSGDALRLTERGVMLGNRVFMEFIS